MSEQSEIYEMLGECEEMERFEEDNAHKMIQDAIDTVRPPMNDEAIEGLAGAIYSEIAISVRNNRTPNYISVNLARAISSGSLDKELEAVGLHRKPIPCSDCERNGICTDNVECPHFRPIPTPSKETPQYEIEDGLAVPKNDMPEKETCPKKEADE